MVAFRDGKAAFNAFPELAETLLGLLQGGETALIEKRGGIFIREVTGAVRPSGEPEGVKTSETCTH